MPPIIGTAMRCITSDPVPVLQRIGTRPAMIATTVIIFGLTIAHHKVVDALRRRGRRRVEPLENFEEFLAAPEAEDPHALSDARKLLKTLAPRQRDIVTSISLDGQSIAATAARLSMSEVAVRVVLHRALKSLGAAWRRSVE